MDSRIVLRRNFETTIQGIEGVRPTCVDTTDFAASVSDAADRALFEANRAGSLGRTVVSASDQTTDRQNNLALTASTVVEAVQKKLTTFGDLISSQVELARLTCEYRLDSLSTPISRCQGILGVMTAELIDRRSHALKLDENYKVVSERISQVAQVRASAESWCEDSRAARPVNAFAQPLIAETPPGDSTDEAKDINARIAEAEDLHYAATTAVQRTNNMRHHVKESPTLHPGTLEPEEYLDVLDEYQEELLRYRQDIYDAAKANFEELYGYVEEYSQMKEELDRLYTQHDNALTMIGAIFDRANGVNKGFGTAVHTMPESEVDESERNNDQLELDIAIATSGSNDIAEQLVPAQTIPEVAGLLELMTRYLESDSENADGSPHEDPVAETVICSEKRGVREVLAFFRTRSLVRD